MSAGVGRERWCLNIWPPLLVYHCVDDRLRPDIPAAVFLIPTTDERIKECDGCFRIGGDGSVEVCSGLLSGDADDIHPVSRRREFLCGEHHMSCHIHLEWIIIPEIRDMLLFFVEAVDRMLDFHQRHVIDPGFVIHIKAGWPLRLELSCGIHHHRTDIHPMRF